MKPALVLHGGAGRLQDPSASRQGILRALRTGYDVLRRTGSALEGAIAAVRVMEDDPVFNCGTGSALTLNGLAQMDASVMTSDGSYGAVGAVERVRNPIELARRVMTETDHLLIAGEWATRLARRWGFPEYDGVVTDEQRKLLAQLRARKSRQYPHRVHYLDFGTVGAVALDRRGRMAVATSTGGTRGKLPGRLGDTAVFGAGTYCCRQGGASATGHGEEIIRNLLSLRVCELMSRFRAPRATTIALAGTRRCGVIALDNEGRVGIGHTTPELAWAYRTGIEERVF